MQKTNSLLRWALRNMLDDAAYPEEDKHRSWIEACLTEAAWPQAYYAGMTPLAIRWASAQSQETGLVLRHAFGQTLSDEERATLTSQERRVNVAHSMQHVLETQSMSIADTADDATRASEALTGSAFARALAQVEHDMERESPPYHDPALGSESPLVRALALIHEDRVQLRGDGSWEVRGQDATYTVSGGACTCKAGQRGKGKCYHVVAVIAMERTRKLLEPAPSLPFGPTTAEERLAQRPAAPTQDAPGPPHDGENDAVPDVVQNASRVARDTHVPTSWLDTEYWREHDTGSGIPAGSAQDAAWKAISPAEAMTPIPPDHGDVTMDTRKAPPSGTEARESVSREAAAPLRTFPVARSTTNGTESPLSRCMSQDHIEHSTAMDQFIPAFIRAQQKMTNVVRDSRNPTFNSRYPSLTAVRDVVTPFLNAEGIAVLQPISTEGSMAVCTTIFWHISGQFLAQTLRLPAVKRAPGRNATPEENARESARGPNAQEFGSASSYARRYQLLAMCNLGSEDDDAEHVTTNEGRRETYETPTFPPSSGRADVSPQEARAEPSQDERAQARAIRSALGKLGFAGGTNDQYKAEVLARTKLSFIPENYAAILAALQAA